MPQQVEFNNESSGSDFSSSEGIGGSRSSSDDSFAEVSFGELQQLGGSADSSSATSSIMDDASPLISYSQVSTETGASDSGDDNSTHSPRRRLTLRDLDYPGSANQQSRQPIRAGRSRSTSLDPSRSLHLSDLGTSGDGAVMSLAELLNRAASVHQSSASSSSRLRAQGNKQAKPTTVPDGQHQKAAAVI